MAKYLIVVPPHFGHINPTLGVGNELIERGHQVVWIGLRDVPKEIFPCGGEYFVPSEFEQYRSEIDSIWNRQEECTQNSVNKMIEWAFESTWLPFCHLMMRVLPTIIKDINPDFIIHDEGLTAVAICAHKANIPYATSISSQPGLYYPNSVLLPTDEVWLTTKMHEVQRQYGVNSVNLVFNSPILNLVYTSRTFVGGSIFPDRYLFVGPALKGRPSTIPFEKELIFEQNKKHIYVSTGSLLKDIKKDFYRKVIEAFDGQDVIVLISADIEIFEQWPTNFIVKSYWNQLELLPYVDAVVSPGGFNTINETLYNGKPMLIIPLANDQFGNSQLIVDRGCGLKLRFRRLTSEDLRVAVFKLLNDVSFRNAAELISGTLKDAGGAVKAAEMLEYVLKQHSKVLEN